MCVNCEIDTSQQETGDIHMTNASHDENESEKETHMDTIKIHPII